jgi:hypothetical protein
MLERAADRMERWRRFWEESLDRLDDYLRDLQRKEKTRDNEPRKK